MKSDAGQANKVRIIGGSLRGRRVEFPARPGLRPTSERIRETLFNWLQREIPGARCLDLFAGSGALGIESLSRGASAVDFVEADSKVCDRLRENLHKLNLGKAQVYQGRALDWIQARSNCVAIYQIAYLDPPYAGASLPAVAASLDSSGLLAASARVYMEHSAPLDSEVMPASWTELKSKRAGQVYYYLYASPKSE